MFLCTKSSFHSAFWSSKDLRRLSSFVLTSLEAIVEIITQASLIVTLVRNAGHLSVRLHLLCLIQTLSLPLCLHWGKSLALLWVVLTHGSWNVHKMCGIVDTVILFMEAHSFLRELLQGGWVRCLALNRSRTFGPCIVVTSIGSSLHIFFISCRLCSDPKCLSVLAGKYPVSL